MDKVAIWKFISASFSLLIFLYLVSVNFFSILATDSGNMPVT